ncbi:SDR family NAD(P)-dependent oxidoreductase [Pontitalea aquivivens]|uniref:SDR family NAD(P)-dependent oxidoreductase n=1 Tax=Pontitalea aquivivens TaxID=3388663 RepID=UPI003970C80A
MDFTGKVALITGGGGGIGRAAGLAFALRGAQVVVVDLDADLGRQTVAEITAQGGAAQLLQADVTKAADVQAYVGACLSAHGRIDAFFNNAGYIGALRSLVDYDEEDFDRVMAINVKGVFLGLKYVLPVMHRQRSGAVVNTASTASIFGPAGQTAYAASKHAVAGLTKVASTESAPFGVRVNAVLPGPVETRMMREVEIGRAPDNPESVRQRTRATIPQGRYAEPAEVAGAVVFLCSDLASGTTGSQLVIDGGRVASGGGVFTPAK